jgi:hypothetical protein
MLGAMSLGAEKAIERILFDDSAAHEDRAGTFEVRRPNQLVRLPRRQYYQGIRWGMHPNALRLRRFIPRQSYSCQECF